MHAFEKQIRRQAARVRRAMNDLRDTGSKKAKLQKAPIVASRRQDLMDALEDFAEIKSDMAW